MLMRKLDTVLSLFTAALIGSLVCGTAREHAPFDFPFQVTLEPRPDGQRFEYAGPVGYIRYYPERKDFGYDTDYSRKADPILAKRMELATTDLKTSGPSAEPVPAAVLS